MDPLDPVAICTLPVEGLSERLTWVREEILSRAVAAERGSDWMAWELADAPGLAAKLDRLVALERECCSGITFEHRPGRAAGRRRLTVSGIDPGAAVFASLEIAADARQRPGPRLARSAAWGVGLGLLVCCALPIAASALLGAAAAPLAALDRPGVIAVAAGLFGGTVFVWQGRQRSPRRGGGCGSGC